MKINQISSFSQLHRKTEEMKKKFTSKVLKNRVDEFKSQTKDFFYDVLDNYWSKQRESFKSQKKEMKTFLACDSDDTSSKYYDEEAGRNVLSTEWGWNIQGWLYYIQYVCNQTGVYSYISSFYDAAEELSNDFSDDPDIPNWATEAVKVALDRLANYAGDLIEDMEDFKDVEEFTIDDWNNFLNDQNNIDEFWEFESCVVVDPVSVDLDEEEFVSELSGKLDNFFSTNYAKLSTEEKKQRDKNHVYQFSDNSPYLPGEKWKETLNSYN